uniref:Uncharacterized protein n=1 Tax=Lotus japonicus TaxID=34305 RepID=I3SAL0_LOTJA|nr:unknown [Lotus japonicus]
MPLQLLLKPKLLLASTTAFRRRELKAREPHPLLLDHPCFFLHCNFCSCWILRDQIEMLC